MRNLLLTVFLLTYYDSDRACTGKMDGITAAGTHAKHGTVACPRTMRFGQLLVIDGEWYTCLDRGSAVTGKHLDVWVPTHAEAVYSGRRYADVEVVK